MKKGLRRLEKPVNIFIVPLKPCPDEEGIKTLPATRLTDSVTLKPCPDEEGIKTE